MSVSRPSTRTRSRRLRRILVGTTTLALSTFALTACQLGDSEPSATKGSQVAADPSATPDPVEVATLVGPDRRSVPVDKMVGVRATGGTLRSVRVSSSEGELAGKLGSAKTQWTAQDRLEPGTDYTVRAVAERSDGQRVTRTSRFHTEDLTLDEQTYPSVAPLADETVGVGMPVIVTFDVPVTDHKTFEKHLHVTSTPQQPGSWHWISDNEVHWRPKTYWKAGTDVSVDVDVNSVPAGNGIYGQEDREIDFHVGDAHIYKVNAQTHQMQVFSNGKLLRTIPVTTGKPGFTTRSGTKVIIEKFASKRMNSETIGIDPNSAEGYDLDDVQWAMRLTYSGEFLHAAPWSVASQGHANVSHGCTGLSTADAKWLYDMSRRGDVVQFTGTDRPMTLTNGYGDWNESFAQYRQGSALS